MNKNIVKKLTVLTTTAIVLLSAANNVNAQQGSVTDSSKSISASNWYISAMAGEQILLKGSVSGKYFVGKINAGTWFDSWSGLKINFQAGLKKLHGNNSSRYYSFGADYTLNMLRVFNPKSYDPMTPFSFSLSAGPAMNFVRYPYKNNDYTPAASINIGVQLGYDFAPRWGVYAEFMSYTMERFYDPGINLFVGFDCAIGLRFKFNAHNYGHRNDDIAYYKATVDELSRKLEALESELDKNRQIPENRKVILAPGENENLSVDIYFDEFSSFISDEQRKKIDGIGEWMAGNPDFNVKIIVFSDNLVDKETGRKIMDKRAEVLEDLLISNYGILPERITSLDSEEAGYHNLTGCNAKIIFTR